MTAWDDIRFEWARGPFRLSFEDSLVVMARIAELEAENAEMREELLAHRVVIDALCNGSAITPAPGVSETHTDPKEEQQ